MTINQPYHRTMQQFVHTLCPSRAICFIAVLAAALVSAGPAAAQSTVVTTPRTVTVTISQDVNAPADSLRIRFRYLDVNRSVDDVVGVLASNQIAVSKDDLVDVGYQSSSTTTAIYPYYSFDIDVPVSGFGDFYTKLAKVNSTQQNSAVSIVSTYARVAALNDDKRAAVLADLAKQAKTRAQALVATMTAADGTAAVLGDIQSVQEFISFAGLKATVSLSATFLVK